MRRGARTILLAWAMCLLAGCGQEAMPLPTPIPTAEPTQTPEVAFKVELTPVARPTASPTPRPAPTRFVPPTGPYIVLLPSSGPPASRQITVRGAHLPPSSPLDLGWSPDGRTAPIVRRAGTDRAGKLVAQFTVPASRPGKYRIVATVNGVRYARAIYRVTSDATLTASAAPSGDAEIVHVHGTDFLPRERLLLVAYPMSVRGKAIIIGYTHCGRRGRFRFHRTLPGLPPGQYALRAYSQDGLSAQMGETFFEVVI